MRVKSHTEVTVGEELPARTLHVDRATLVHYAGASGDRNVIHWDEQTARAVGLPDVIAHGMWTMGSAIEAVTDWVGDPARVLEYRTRFTRPVVVPHDGGADVEVTAVVTSVDPDTRQSVVELTASSAGQKVLGRCTARVQLD